MEIWDDLKRQDGLVIIARGLTGFMIVAADGETLDTCPCCTKPFRTLDNAKRAADIVFPVALPSA